MLLTNQKPPFSRASFFSFESWPGNCFAGVRSRAVQWGASWTFAPACLHCTVISNGKKPLKKSSTKVIFTSFSLQVSVNLHKFRFRLPALHIQDLWNRCIHKYNPTISRIFWNSFLAFFFEFGPIVRCKMEGSHFGWRVSTLKLERGPFESVSVASFLFFHQENGGFPEFLAISIKTFGNNQLKTWQNSE